MRKCRETWVRKFQAWVQLRIKLHFANFSIIFDFPTLSKELRGWLEVCQGRFERTLIRKSVIVLYVIERYCVSLSIIVRQSLRDNVFSLNFKYFLFIDKWNQANSFPSLMFTIQINVKVLREEFLNHWNKLLVLNWQQTLRSFRQNWHKLLERHVWFVFSCAVDINFKVIYDSLTFQEIIADVAVVRNNRGIVIWIIPSPVLDTFVVIEHDPL